MGVKSRLARGRFLFLLVALVLLIFGRPIFIEQSVIGGLLLVALMLSALFAVAGSDKKVFAIAIALGAPHLIALWAGHLILGEIGFLVALVFGILFYGYIIVVLLRYLLNASSVTADILYGSVSIYFLLGFTWAMAYVIVEILHPGSLLIDGATLSTFNDYLYFSYLTLATLGYGDIAPTSLSARSLSIIEAITGVFFTTVLVARMVGLSVVTLTQKKQNDHET